MELKDIFQELLTKNRALYLFYQTAHWITQGKEYYSDHLLYQRLYEGIADEIDQIGEKAMGLTLDPSSVDLATSILPILDSMAAESVEYQELVPVAIELEEEFLELLAEINSLELTPGLADMIGSIASAHEGHLYLLQNRNVAIANAESDESAELFKWNSYVVSLDLPIMGDGTITGKISAPTGWVGTWNCYPNGNLGFSDELNVPEQIKDMLRASCDGVLRKADQKVREALENLCVEVKIRIQNGKVNINDLINVWKMIKATKKSVVSNLVDHRILTYIEKFNNALLTMDFKDQDITEQQLQEKGLSAKAIENAFVNFYESIKPFEKLIF